MTDVFTKKYNSHELFREALACSSEAYDVSLKTKYLRVPKVVSSNSSELTIDFEMMEGWDIFTSLIRDYNFLGLQQQKVKDIFYHTGMALAEYHKFTGKVHRDFDSTNVMYNTNSNRICLIDFSRPDFANYPTYNNESIYWDLALMLIHLRIKYPPQKIYFLFRPMNRIISKQLLTGYFQVSNSRYDYEALLTKYRECLALKYIAKTFVCRFLSWSWIFNMDDLKKIE